MTENKEMKTEQEYIKIQLSDISPNPQVDYMHTLYGDEMVGTRSNPLEQLTRGQLTSCDEVVICSMYTRNNIEDLLCFPFFYTYKKDDNNNMTENKDFEIKDIISLDNIMIENN